MGDSSFLNDSSRTSTSSASASDVQDNSAADGATSAGSNDVDWGREERHKPKEQPKQLKRHQEQRQKEEKRRKKQKKAEDQTVAEKPYRVIRKKNGLSLFKCRRCSFDTDLRRTVMRHQNVHDRKRVECRYCDDDFSRQDILNDHVRRKHPEKAPKSNNTQQRRLAAKRLVDNAKRRRLRNSQQVATNRSAAVDSSARSSARPSDDEEELPTESPPSPHRHSVACFELLGEISNTVDALCRGEDKEEIQSFWDDALPILKTRSADNGRKFCAASKVLASLSLHAHTRPIWKKAAMNLFLDSNFFKMDVQSLRIWLVTVDNIVSHDIKKKGGFKQLMNTIAGPASNTLLSLSTSKKQEYKMRAAGLKRLALILLGIDSDEFPSILPKIQAILTENLRIGQAPHVHANVFLCLKVLLMRLSTKNLAALWPTIITKLVQVLSQIEQELKDTSGTHQLRAARDDQWLSLYLSACKLLEALCLLRASGRFQMYQWAFASDAGDTSEEYLFVPHAVRISKLLQRKYGQVHAPARHAGQSRVTPLLLLGDTKVISQLKDLTRFFYNLSYSLVMATTVADVSLGADRAAILNPAVKAIAASICVDLADGWAS